MITVIIIIIITIENAFQPGLGVCGASLSFAGRLVLSDLIGARNRQMVNVRQDHNTGTVKRMKYATLCCSSCNANQVLMSGADKV